MTVNLSPEDAARIEAARKEIAPSKDAPSESGESAQPSHPASAGLPAEPRESGALPPGETDANDPLSAGPLRKRLLAVCLDAVLKQSDFFEDAHGLVGEMLGHRLELDKDGTPRLRSGEELVALTVANVQEALGAVGEHLRKAKGFGGSGTKGSREIRSSSRPAWMESQESFEKSKTKTRATRKGAPE